MAKIKPARERYSGGILKFIAEENDNTLDWSGGMTEADWDKWTNGVFKHSDITAEWCRKAGYNVKQDENGHNYIQNHFGRLYILR